MYLYRYSGDARALDKELGDWLRPIPLQVMIDGRFIILPTYYLEHDDLKLLILNIISYRTPPRGL